jgi:hypothetical protein
MAYFISSKDLMSWSSHLNVMSFLCNALIGLILSTEFGKNLRIKFIFPKNDCRDFLLVLELLHTHLGFSFPKVFPCLLVIISHYPVSYILGENIPPEEYSLSVDTSV